MKTARQSDIITWWRMGRNASIRYGIDKALQMSDDITSTGAKRLWRSGALGEPKPRVRRATQSSSTEG
jgi:hypothetical protein